MKVFNYCAFGLQILADFECDGLLVSHSSLRPVRFRLAPPDASLENHSPLEGLNPLICHVPFGDVAEFRIEGGQQITVKPNQGMDPAAMRLFLLGRAMTALLQQRLIPVLHGSSVMTPHGAAVFTGPSGTGKSMLAAAFHRRGFKVLTDDVSAVENSLVLPGTPRLLLWGNSLRDLGIDSAPLQPVRAGAEKYIFPLGAGFEPEPARLRKIYVVRDSETPSITPVRGAEKFALLLASLFCPEYLVAMGIESEYVARVTELAVRSEVAILERDPAPSRLDEAVDLVLSDVC